MKRRDLRAGLPIVVLLSALGVASVTAQTPPANPGRDFQLRFEAGLLSLQAENVALADLLRAIGDAAGFEVTIDRDLGTRKTVSVNRQPLRQVFKRLLEKNSYLVFFDEQQQVRELRVLSAFAGGDAPERRPAVVEADNPTTGEIEVWILDRLASPEQNERIVAVRRMTELEADSALNLVNNVLLSDPNPAVRGEAVAVLGRIDSERVPDLLEMATRDADASVRKRAIGVWRSLGGSRAAEALRQLSVTDSNEEARQMAQSALQALEAGDTPAADQSEGAGDGIPVTQ